MLSRCADHERVQGRGKPRTAVESQPRSVRAVGRGNRTTWHREGARTLLVLVGNDLMAIEAVVCGSGAGSAVATALILPQC